MLVLKFGGSSVADATNISKVMDIVTAAAESDRVLIVCSAIKGCTDTLIKEGATDTLRQRHHDIIRRLFTGSEREEADAEMDSMFDFLETGPDCIEAYGEILSTRIIARKLSCDNYKTLWIDSRDLIKVENGKVREDLSFPLIRKTVKDNPSVRIFVAPGFIASNIDGSVTTLGRGGSDYSAALFAAGAGDGSSLEIWTDVPGIMTTNPKTVPSARTIPRMSYHTALCMAEHGAKVLYAPTVMPAMRAAIEFKIKDTFHPECPGTTVLNLPESEICQWIGLSDMEINGCRRLCLTAEGPIDTKRSLQRLSSCLKDAGISEIASGSEERHIWADVREEVLKTACGAVHREFFEEPSLSSTDVYIAGYGAVGKALEAMIAAGAGKESGRRLNVVEISSDRGFAEKVLKTAHRHSVFIDCTDSENIYRMYVPLLEAGIDIVSSNRRSLSVPYVDYAAMKMAALRSGCFLRYSTTVGTSLPMLEMLSSAAVSGDSIESVEAVVSCTLNHIITGYDGANSEHFATLLRQAQEEGLTEDDPRTDLGGGDALRKLLILGREAGIRLEGRDVTVVPMLPEEYFNCSLDEFYEKLERNEPEFIRREAEMDSKRMRQRFMASLKKDPSSPLGYKAEIKMQMVGEDSPFFWISGTENVIQIKTRYSAPLVIKGAGEGAKLAAAGIINDIIRK